MKLDLNNIVTHTFDTWLFLRTTCTVTTRDCRSSVNFVLRAWIPSEL